MKTLNQFFKVYKNKLPVSYVTFKNKVMTDKDIEKLKEDRIIFVLGGEKRKIIKVLDDDAFFNYFFGGRNV